MADTTHPLADTGAKSEPGFVRAIGLFDGTMIVVGSMIGSGIFIVAADISRQTGSAGGLLLTWILTGLLTISAALSYGELAALFPHAGGQYVYLREAYSPLWGFLYGWTLFLVIQTGTIAAVAVGFARYLGVLWTAISPSVWIIHPIALGSKYAISLSVQQFVGVLMIVFLTFINTLGVRLGKLIQNVFTSAKTLSLVGLIFLGIFVGRNAGAITENFSHFWTIRNAQTIEPGASFLKSFVPTITAASGVFGLFVAYGVAQVGSLFSADAWNNIGFTAAEVKNPKRDVALSMAFGTIIVITLYCLANLAYLCTLPLVQIQTAPDDRVASAALNAIFGPTGAMLMAGAIIISTFGCNNGLILAGARVTYAMARDGLFFKSTGTLNKKGVPGNPDFAENSARGRGRSGNLRQSLQRPAQLRCFCRVALLRADDRGDFRAACKTAGCRAAVSRVRVPGCSCTVYSCGGGNYVCAFALPDANLGKGSGDRFAWGSRLSAMVVAVEAER